MSNDEIINNAINKYHDECSKLSDDLGFVEKAKIHEDLLIKIILETILNQ